MAGNTSGSRAKWPAKPVRGEQVIHLSNSLGSGKQLSIDRPGFLESPYIDNQIDQSVEIANGADVADFGPFNPQSLGLTVDTLAGGALVVDRTVLGAAAIKQDAAQATQLDVDVLDTALVFGELGMVTRLACALRKEKGTAIALGAVAMGMLERVGGMHAQATRTPGDAIGVKEGLGDLA